MKHCPVCHTQYDEEVLRFCTKDGAPLIEEDQPHFDAMPSESMESDQPDFGEDTVVRNAPPVVPVAAQTENPRIVIPTTEDPQPRQTVRSRPPSYVPPPQKPNTGKVVALTVICTLAVIAGVAAVVMLLRGGEPTNTNVNLSANMFNLNTNLNNNLNIDANFNYNSSININSTTIPNLNLNFNTNSNLKSPTPTRTPTPTPSPSASPSPTPSASPTPARSPSPSASATPRFPHDPGPPMMRVSPTPRRTP